MEYRHKHPVTKRQRALRNESQRQASQARETKNRRNALAGGKPNELGVTQGQNGEQGNSVNPVLNQPLSRRP